MINYTRHKLLVSFICFLSFHVPQTTENVKMKTYETLWQHDSNTLNTLPAAQIKG